MEIKEEPLFCWEEIQGGVRITGCTQSLHLLTVPETIAGLPVVQIGDYAFQGMEALEEAELPHSLEFLGDHVFFNCIHLEKLTAYDRLKHVGDGAFKNCDHLSEIRLHVYNNHASALRLLISDVMQDVRVEVLYGEEEKSVPDRTGEASMNSRSDRIDKNGRIDKARLMFPAFYFDYIENYPARIFEEVIYGAGQAYRQCFRGGDVDYEAYDRLFERSAREDSPQVVLEHAVGRLACPHRLGEERSAVYRAWLSAHGPELLKKCMDMDAPEDLELMLSLDLYDEEQTKVLLSQALQSRKVEFVNLLMAYQGRRFAGGGRRKKYIL